MTGFIIKIIVCPIALILSNYLFSDISYPYLYQPIFVGVILASLAHILELAILKPGTLLTSTAADFLLAFAIVYFSQFILPGASINLIGASLSATLLALAEFFQHLYLIKSGKTKKV